MHNTEKIDFRENPSRQVTKQRKTKQNGKSNRTHEAGECVGEQNPELL